MGEQGAEYVNQAEARAERDAMVLAYISVVLTWLILLALNVDYFAPASNIGLLVMAYVAHRRQR